MFAKSGISHHGSYLPAWINPTLTTEPKYDMATAKLEAEMTMCGAMADLLEKTGVCVGGGGAVCRSMCACRQGNPRTVGWLLSVSCVEQQQA